MFRDEGLWTGIYYTDGEMLGVLDSLSVMNKTLSVCNTGF